MTVTDVDKSKLITTFNKWVGSIQGEEEARVSNEMKLFLINSFPDMIEEAFPQKKSLFDKLRPYKKLNEEGQE